MEFALGAGVFFLGVIVGVSIVNATRKMAETSETSVKHINDKD